MLLSRLLSDVEVLSPFFDREIADITDSTEKVRKNSAFVCVKGMHKDGHSFASEAVSSGAAAVIAEHDVNSPLQVIVKDSRKAYAVMCKNFFSSACESLSIIGVTGTNGKTSVSFIIRDILKALGVECGLIGTVENAVGKNEYPSKLTTPDAYEIHRLFSLMKKENIKYCAVEASSQALHQKRLYGVNFDVGVFTNFTEDHLDYHKTAKEYLRCKKLLFKNTKTAVLNADDAASAEIAEGLNLNKITYGKKDADFKAENLKLFSNRVEYTVGGFPVIFNTPGEFSLYNSLAAVAAVTALGFELSKVTDAVKYAGAVKGRFETVKTDRDFSIIIDYAHTPDGLKKAISTAKAITKGRVITVFGCGGDRDSLKRPKMGSAASNLSDAVVITSDNPRTEEPQKIIADILKGVDPDSAEIHVIEDRYEAIEYAVLNARAGDTVLIAGKGHETYQIKGKEKIHFDEREIVESILKKGV